MSAPALCNRPVAPRGGEPGSRSCDRPPIVAARVADREGCCAAGRVAFQMKACP